jgi:hypothetical protein
MSVTVLRLDDFTLTLYQVVVLGSQEAQAASQAHTVPKLTTVRTNCNCSRYDRESNATQTTRSVCQVPIQVLPRQLLQHPALLHRLLLYQLPSRRARLSEARLQVAHLL